MSRSTATKAPPKKSSRTNEARGPETRRRLLEAASAAFAEHGFRDASLRDICKRAGANVAAVNYHFRSKDNLHVEVLRDAFARIGVERPLRPYPHPPKDPAEARERLVFVIRQLAEGILETRPSYTRLIMLREMYEPSKALDQVFEEFIQPRVRAIEDAVAYFLPGASPRAITHHAISVLGQIVYHRCAAPVALAILGEKAYSAALVEEIIEHVLQFSERALGAAS